MSTETTNKKIKIDNGTTFGKTYTDKAIDERLQGLVSTATFTPVQEKANNSLQKPAGLIKTKLVGVGTNGQENIEIGDNLTLANGKLSATGGGTGMYNHFISIINNNNNNTFYFIFQSSNSNKVSDHYDLKKNLSNKVFLCNGHTDSEKAEYISGRGSNIIVGVVDNSDNSTSGINIDNSYSISDDVSPVE